MELPPPDELRRVLGRVQAVLDSKLSASELVEDEQLIYFDLLGQHNQNRAEASAFAAELLEEAGNVGYDGEGHLVRTLGGGKVKRIDPSDGV